MHLKSRRPLGAVLACAALSLPLLALSPAVAATTTAITINEVESSGGTPGDWIELANSATSAVSVSGFVLKDNDDSHSYTIASGTSIPAAGHLALDVDPSFGLGSSDSARLFAADGKTLLDSYTWTSHASTTYGRCPDATGAFTTTVASTKGATNSCQAAVTAPTVSAWPGGSATATATADAANTFGTNLSGLAYEASGSAAAGTLWAIKNGPSTLYQLTSSGSQWAPATGNGWGAGKALHYADGSGDPDTEGVALTSAGPSGGVFASTERDNDNNGTSRLSVLRFDPTGSATSVNATSEWNLTSDLPAVDPNSGLEAIAWVPDSALVAQGFVDQKTGAAYSASTYANHGTGLFFVGLEANATIYAYALNQTTSGFTRVATIASGFAAVMDLAFEPSTNRLWAERDNTCNGRTTTLEIAQSGSSAGSFVATDTFERPSTMANLNNEGFALAPQALCVNGLMPAYWSDDSNDDSHALRSGTVNCTA